MANEKRLIYAEDAMKWIRESKVPETGAFTKGINKGLNIALSTLGNNEVLPAVDAVEVVHGRWIKTNKYDEDSSVQCSKCLMEFDYIDGACYLVIGSELPNYCPNCGADMRG